ncbi:MAG: pitrilysin family protein [Planctomycetota bacterium]
MFNILSNATTPGIDVTLPNGLRFVGDRLEQGQAVALAVRIPVGSKDDPGNKFGLVNLVKDVLFKGTKRRTARAFSDAMDFYGISYGAYTTIESTTIELRFLPEYLEQSLKLLRELLGEPSFPNKECATAKRQVIQELKHLEDTPLSHIFVILKDLFFGSEWGHLELGTETSVSELGRGDIQAFWKTRYIPAGALVAAAGRFDPGVLRSRLETLFANTGEAWLPESPPAPPATHKVQHVFKDSEQTQIALAFPCVPRNDPAHYVAQIAVGILSNISGRLFTEIREKRGLAYSVGASAVSLRGSGAILAYAGTTTSRAAETLNVLKNELINLPNGLTTEEVERVKTNFKAHILMDQESTSVRARELLEDVFFENRSVPLNEIAAKINAVTLDDIKTYWAAHAVEPYTLATLGRETLE